MSHNDFNHESEGGFYKGLFYGVVLGLGIVWFFGTKEGKELKDDLLAKGQNFLDNSRNLQAQMDEDEPVPPLHG